MAGDGLDAERDNPYRSPEPVSEPPPRFARVVAILIGSWLIISTIGAAAIFVHWYPIDRSIAVARSLGFVAIMAGVHFVGFRVWWRQFDSPGTAARPAKHAQLDRKVPLWVVITVVVLGLMMLLSI